MLSDRRREILEFIQESVRTRGLPPTIREIGEKFQIASTNGVRFHLALLEKAGHLKRQGKISRGIEVTDRGTHPGSLGDDDALGIPLLGRVAAGAPILAEESFEGSIRPARFFGDRDGLFALKVRGDSMIDAGILDGDYVVVRGQEQAQAGEMVVALLGDEATVKYYQPRGAHIELRPANAKYQPIPVEPGADFRVIGVVRGVIRTVGR